MASRDTAPSGLSTTASRYLSLHVQPKVAHQLFQIFDFLYENGCTHWDTADVYGEGEALIGEWSFIVSV